jgi:hypothetical protein
MSKREDHDCRAMFQKVRRVIARYPLDKPELSDKPVTMFRKILEALTWFEKELKKANP